MRNLPLCKHHCLFQGCYPNALNATISPGYRERRILLCPTQCCTLANGPQSHTGEPKIAEGLPWKQPHCFLPIASFFSLCASLMLNSKTNTQTPSISVRNSHSTDSVQTVPRNIFPTLPTTKEEQICKDIVFTKTYTRVYIN